MGNRAGRRGPVVFLGLDLETTGLDPAETAICQVGLALGTLTSFRQDVRPWEKARIEPEALAVNKFTGERLARGAVLGDADIQAAGWLRFELIQRYPGNFEKPIEQQVRVVPVGWNVAGFDLLYVARYLPRLFEDLHYQSVELNSICYALGNHGAAKGALKNATYELLGLVNEHDAEFDAIAALAAYRIACEWVAQGRIFRGQG